MLPERPPNVYVGCCMRELRSRMSECMLRRRLSLLVAQAKLRCSKCCLELFFGEIASYSVFINISVICKVNKMPRLQVIRNNPPDLRVSETLGGYFDTRLVPSEFFSAKAIASYVPLSSLEKKIVHLRAKSSGKNGTYRRSH